MTKALLHVIACLLQEGVNKFVCPQVKVRLPSKDRECNWESKQRNRSSAELDDSTSVQLRSLFCVQDVWR